MLYLNYIKIRMGKILRRFQRKFPRIRYSGLAFQQKHEWIRINGKYLYYIIFFFYLLNILFVKLIKYIFIFLVWKPTYRRRQIQIRRQNKILQTIQQPPRPH